MSGNKISKRAPRMAAEQRRAELIEVASKLFCAHGYDKTSIQQVIDAAGVSKGAFYHHFASKEAILEAMVDHWHSDYAKTIDGLAERYRQDAIAAWLKLFQASQLWEIENKESLYMLYQILMDENNLRIRQRMIDKSNALLVREFTKVIGWGQLQGCFDVQDARMSAFFVVATMNAAGMDNLMVLTSDKDIAWIYQRIQSNIESLQQCFERLLGTPAGTLPIINDETLAHWLEIFI